MSRIDSLSDIESVFVHWSESALINDELGANDDDDIEKPVDPARFDEMVVRAAKGVTGGYDKTSLSIVLKGGVKWATGSKFYLSRTESGLLSLLNRGE
jgi:hypothetical protein